MNSKPALLRSFAYTLFGIGVIAVCVLLWHSRLESSITKPVSAHVLCPSADPNPNSAIGIQVAAPLGAAGQKAADAATLTGDAAKAELRKNGQSASLGAALAAARHAMDKIDPTGPNSRGAEYFAANPWAAVAGLVFERRRRVGERHSDSRGRGAMELEAAAKWGGAGRFRDIVLSWHRHRRGQPG